MMLVALTKAIINVVIKHKKTNNNNLGSGIKGKSSSNYVYTIVKSIILPFVICYLLKFSVSVSVV